MLTIDLSHTFMPGMPVFPGTEPPLFMQGNTVAEHGFAEKIITFFSHTGTHLDAPAHIFADQPSLDQLPIDRFLGRAICIKLPREAMETIECHHLHQYLQQLENIQFVLFASGWSQFWGLDTYFCDYPVLSPDAARLLCRFKLQGVGFDTISADRIDSHNLPIHRILLKHMVIIENLNNLEMLPDHPFLFSALPLKIAGGDGSPVRAVAICDRSPLPSMVSRSS